MSASEESYRFCTVYTYRKRLFLDREEGVRGPRLALFPPRELSPEVGPGEIGHSVLDALNAYRETGQAVEAADWERHNRRLLAHFGEKSVSSFERRKRGVTVRQDTTGTIQLLSPDEHPLVLVAPSEAELGSAILGALHLV